MQFIFMVHGNSDPTDGFFGNSDPEKSPFRRYPRGVHYARSFGTATHFPETPFSPYFTVA